MHPALRSRNWYGSSPTGPLYFPAWVSSSNNLELVRAQQQSSVEKSADQRDAIWNRGRTYVDQ